MSARDEGPDRAVAVFLIVVAIVLGLVLFFRSPPARSHGPYGDWKTPTNPKASCCNDADCRPTTARLGGDGLWEAWNGRQWLTVPANTLLPPDYAGDGRSHLCEKDGFIYCFTPASPRI